jgi:hypothetical protein
LRRAFTLHLCGAKHFPETTFYSSSIISHVAVFILDANRSVDISLFASVPNLGCCYVEKGLLVCAVLYP